MEVDSSSLILLITFLSIISLIFAYLNAFFIILPGIKIRKILISQKKKLNIKTPIPRIRLALQFILIIVNIPLIFLLYKFVSLLLKLENIYLEIIISTAIIILIMILMLLIIPILLNRKERKSLSEFEIKLMKIANSLASIFIIPIWKLLKFDKKEIEENYERSEEDIQVLLDVGLEEGIVKKEEEQLFQGILDFSEATVKEIMVPRTEMVCISADAKIEELIEKIAQTGHSKIPVYRGNIDNIIGIIYLKELFYNWDRIKDGNIKLEELIKKPYIVPETKRIKDLLKEFQQKRIHIAIVVDEFGGVEGLVTLEDLIEEIVGDIRDEYDKEEEEIKKISADVYEIKASASIKDIEDIFNIEFPEGDFETIGGFIYLELGKIPKVGETLIYKNLKITILEATERVIKKIKIERIKEEEDESK